MTEFAELDSSLNADTAEQIYEQLKKRPDAKSNVEVLWRMAKCCNELSGKYESNDKRKEKIIEGRKYALDAYNAAPKHFLSAKWAAIMTGQLTNYVGTKERIELGVQMKGIQDEALAMEPKDSGLLHLRGRFSYSIANLSWVEKKAASMFFATLPPLTIDDALRDFLATYEIRPDWIENLVYIARCYQAKKDRESAKKFYAMAAAIQPSDAAEAELIAEAQAFVNKH